MIRDLTPEDTSILADFFRRAEDHIRRETGYAPDRDTVEDFLYGVPPGSDAALSERVGLFDGQGRLIGVTEQAYGFPVDDDAYIGQMVLVSDCRGQGSGPRLLEFVTGRARLRGAVRQYVAVLETNRAARRFWERHGFVTVLTVPAGRSGSPTHSRYRMERPIRQS